MTQAIQIRIMHGDSKKPSAVITAAQLRQAWDKSFGQTIPYPSPTDVIMGLWLHLFLWGMSPQDRATMVGMILGREVEVSEIIDVPQRYQLKAWEDFPDAYTEAPIQIEILQP